MSQPKTPIDFDIDRYMRASKRLDLSGLDWDDIPNHELSDGDVMCMRRPPDVDADVLRPDGPQPIEVAPTVALVMWFQSRCA